MPAGNWVQRDQLRESWLFLLLGTERSTHADTGERKLQYWECGVGNADQLISTKTVQTGCGHVETESDLLTALLSQLGQYRYQDTVVITCSEGTLQTLRRRFAANDTEIVSLRGLSNICVEDLLERYFDQTLADYGLDQDSLTTPRRTDGSQKREVVTAGSVQEFWEVWQHLYQLLPAAELAGDEL